MNANKILKVQRPTKPQTPPPPLDDSAIKEAVEALQRYSCSAGNEECDGAERP